MQYRTLAYGASLPEVAASAENADVTVVQASAANGMRASIYVQPKMVALFKPMQFNSLKKRQNWPLELTSGASWQSKRRPNSEIVVLAHYQDGTQAVLPADKVTFSTSGEGEVTVRKECLSCINQEQSL